LAISCKCLQIRQILVKRVAGRFSLKFQVFFAEGNHAASVRRGADDAGARASTVSGLLTVGFSHARYPNGNRTSSISLPHLPARHPPPGRHRAGLCQPPPPLGFCPRPGSRRDRRLEGGRPHPSAVGAFAGTEATARRGPTVGAEADAAGPAVTVLRGTGSPQDQLFAADQIYLDFVGRDTLYGYLTQNWRVS